MATIQQRRLILGSLASAITYLLGPFRFATDEAAPMVSPHTEAGAVGGLKIIDTTNKAATSDDKLAYSGGAGAWGDPGVWSVASFARVAGRALFIIATIPGGGGEKFGFANSQAGNFGGNLPGGLFTGGTVQSAAGGATFGTYVAAIPTEFAAVLRGTGDFLLQKIAGTWTLLWVNNADTTTPLYAAVINFSSTGFAADDFRVTDLSDSWATDYGIATQRLAGARAALDAYTHTADALIEFVATTLPSAGSIDVRFRVQDASNYWIARISTTGALSLIEVVAGGETSRASAAGVIVAGHRVVIIAAGTSIQGVSNNVSRWTYASATNFQTATAGSIASLGTGGAVSGLVAWPRNPTVPSGV